MKNSARFRVNGDLPEILVTVGSSSPSNSALLEAIKPAKSQHARIELLHVVENNRRVLDPECHTGNYDGNVIEFLRGKGRKVLYVAAALVRQFGLATEMLAVESQVGNIAAVIVAQAHEWAAKLPLWALMVVVDSCALPWEATRKTSLDERASRPFLVHGGSTNTPEAQLKERDTGASINASARLSAPRNTQISRAVPGTVRLAKLKHGAADTTIPL